MPPGWRTLAAAGLLLLLAFPPFELVLPAFVALAPLGVWIARRSDGGEALRGGVWFGVALWLLLLRWLPVTLARFLPGALPGWLAVVAVLGLLTGVVVWAAWRLHHRVGVPLFLALPLAWTAGEWLRANLPGSLAFPWLELSVSLAATPELLGVAEIVGSRGTGFLLALVSGLLAAAWLRATGEDGPADLPPSVAGGGPGARLRPSRGAAPAAAALLVVAGMAGWGVHRSGTLETRPGPRVAVVQSAVPQELKNEPLVAAERGVAALERLLPLAVGGEPVDLVMAPESLLPLRLAAPESAELRARLEAAVRRAGVPLLVGALGLERAGAGPADDVVFNSVFLVHPVGGVAPRRYDKRRLVPVVERVPLPRWAGGGPGGRWGSYGAGASPDPIPVGGWRAGVLVCLESSFSSAARAARRAGADLLVNPTNDAWLNGPAAWLRSSALRQHPAHLVVRAVETRTPAARAANTGISLFVDVAGRSHGVIRPFEEGVSLRRIRTPTGGPTPFVRLGDVAGAGAAGVTLLLLLAGVRTRGRRRFARRHTGAGGG